MNLGERFLSYIVLVVVILLGVKLLPAIPISSVVTQKQSDFSVSGTGKVTVIPDMALISLSMQVSKPTVKQAQTDANNVINQVTESLKKLGIEDRDIKTENYSIFPEYDYTSGRGRITGYHVSANLVVKVRDLEKINSVIDQSSSLGINTVGNIQLTVNDERLKELQRDAREEAVEEAKQKANDLANASGMKLGKIINVTESTPGVPVPLFAEAKALDVGRGGGSDTQIQPGSTDITSTITLTFETR